MLPPLGELGASLRRITETLAHELAHPGPAAPDWSPTEWRLARAVAAMHGVSPLLARRLRWQGPAGWVRFLHEQLAHAEARHLRIEQLLGRLDDGARRAGFVWIGLKGSALYALGVYRPGERPMADVDLLVSEADAPCAARVLGGLGFRETLVTWKHRVFEAADRAPAFGFGENSGNGLKIDLHTRISELLPRQATDITEVIYPRAASPGLGRYSSKAALLTHLLLHAAGAMPSQALRLLQLHDIALLCAQLTREEWQVLLDGDTGICAPMWWAFPPLQLTSRYYQSVPDWVLSRVAGDCPWLLRSVARRRTLSDVSLSRPAISAFPGLVWARTPLAMLDYVRWRVAPDARTRAVRKECARSEPPLAASEWAHLSQARRILRWVTSRTGRPETLHAVGTALTLAD